MNFEYDLENDAHQPPEDMIDFVSCRVGKNHEGVLYLQVISDLKNGKVELPWVDYHVFCKRGGQYIVFKNTQTGEEALYLANGLENLIGDSFDVFGDDTPPEKCICEFDVDLEANVEWIFRENAKFE